MPQRTQPVDATMGRFSDGASPVVGGRKGGAVEAVGARRVAAADRASLCVHTSGDRQSAAPNGRPTPAGATPGGPGALERRARRAVTRIGGRLVVCSHRPPPHARRGPRLAEKWAVMAAQRPIGPRGPMPALGAMRDGPSRVGWPSGRRCNERSRRNWPSIGPLSRLRGGSRSLTPTIRACRSPTKPSIEACLCRVGGS